MLEGYEEDTYGFWDDVTKDGKHQREAALPISALPKEKDIAVEATIALETKPDPGYSFQELQEFRLPPGPKAIVTMNGYKFLSKCDFRSAHEAHEWKKARSPWSTCIDFWDLSQIVHRRRLIQALPGDYFIAPNKGFPDANGKTIACRGFGIYTKQGIGNCDWPRHDYNPNVVPLHTITTVEP